METVLGYVRVSTEEQATSGLGLADQRRAIAAEADRRGCHVEWVEDAGYSARDLRRPGVATALDRLASGEARTLVVSKLDRLSRSLVDFAGLMARAQKQGWALVALDLGVDTTTASGELVANVMAAVAQWERRIISDRTKAALAMKRAEGVRLGRPLTLAPALRQRIAGERAKGVSLRAIAAGLNADGVPTAHGGAHWRPSTVRGVLDSVQLDAEVA